MRRRAARCGPRMPRESGSPQPPRAFYWSIGGAATAGPRGAGLDSPAMAPRLITSIGSVPPSLARVEEPSRPPFRVGLVQHRWHQDAAEHEAALAEGIAMAAGEGARLVCLQELTLSRTSRSLPTRSARRRRWPSRSRTGARRSSPPAAPPSTASTSTPRSTSAPRTAGSATTPRSSSGPTARWSRARASCTSRSPPATTRTSTSGRATTRRAIRSSSWGTGASASRPAGTSGSRSSPARTRSAAPR